MRLVSVNVGLPRDVYWQGKTVTTGIFKEPVNSPIMLNTLNLVGDKQADLSVHGGLDKAVYAYPIEHYEFWRGELPDIDFSAGVFGENFTTEGIIEDSVLIGDRYRIGGAEVIVTQPRLPCYKLGIRFGRADMVKKFLASRRTGFYLGVLREGVVEAGNKIELIGREERTVSVADITRIYALEREDMRTLELAVEVEALPEKWKEYLRKRIEKLNG
ncbi:MAG TPA: MOSC domain-containing protein [Blastocatellia bacterium]|nr:MOSC domain-containing protein [Blastocatellia bacterium]